MKIITPHGEMVISLYDETPQTTKNFKNLVNNNFYSDLNFHRVIPGFVVQGGCPNGNGSGGPGYTIKCECDSEKQYHEKGVLSMAHRGKDTGGSQFFICLNRHTTQHLDGVHTCFGRVVKGLEILDKIKQGDKFSVVKK
jgi:peptidyl-prolyl cis-trans isomerase B (cyclophilin B)